jgi:Ca-activated chloride channel family protein
LAFLFGERMKVMKKFCIIVSLIMIIGCGGGGDDGGSVGTAPTINNVVLTDENFIPKSQFDIGDTANILVQATDPDKNMKKLLIEQYFPNDSTGNPYYGPDVIALSSQSDITMTYHLIGRITVDGPAGNWRIEFQIEDSTGLESNLFKVFAVVNRVPSIQVLPSSYDFGNVTVGNSTAPLEVEITNNGSVGLTVNDIILSDTTNFALDLTGGTHPCTTPSRIISAGANCTFEVNFSPGSYNTFDANLIISSNDYNNLKINVPLSGIRDDAVSELNVRINQVESTSCPIPMVTAYVSVTDQGGYPVTTLTVYEFLITEVGGYVGFPTEARFVSDVSATISVALVMDYSLSITGLQDSVDDMQESVASFVDNLGQDDDAEIIKFATTIAVAQDFTSDKNLLTDAITAPLDVGIHSALYDAVVKAVNDTALSLKDRKAVVVITDGTDDDGSGSPLSTNNLNDVINYANGTGVPIFTVGVGGKINSAVLQQMANYTGGQSYSAATSDNLRNIYNQLASILFQDQYVLTYNSGIVAGKTYNLTIKATELTSGVTGNDTKEITPCP